jgi:translocation and assembly module TamA
LSLVLLLLAGCETAKKDQRPDVDNIDIKGNSALSGNDLKRKILTSEQGIIPEWFPFIGEHHPFDASAWAADLRRIERYYQANGYYQAKVVDSEVEENKPGHVKLKLELEEGKPARILELDITGLDELPADHRAAALKGLPLYKLAIFREAEWEESKARLLRNLQEKGYAEATIDSEAVVDELLNIVRIRIDVTPRQRYRFGPIVVATGEHPHVSQQVVKDAVASAVKTGDWYDESKLTDAQANIFQLGVFAAVKVNRGAPDRAKGEVPIVADVREAPFHTVRAGGGFGIDTLRDEVRATGEYTDRDFFGGLRRLTVKGKVGWAFLPSVVNVIANTGDAQNGPIAKVTTEFEQPHFLATTLSGTVAIQLDSDLEPAYRYAGGNLKVGLPWRPTPRWTIYPSYNLDVYVLSSQVPLGATGPEVLFGCPNVCIVSYLEQLIEWDLRDNRLEPRSGTFASLSLQEGGGPLGGAFKFVRITPEVRGYISFGLEKRFTIAARAKVGDLISFNSDGSTPIISRFFSGGNSMRGFGTRRLAPMAIVEQPGVTTKNGIPNANPVPTEAVPIGGKGLVEASLELRYNVWGDLVIALFGDSGAVTADSLGDGPLWPYYYVAVGLGARYRTALGPIRVDFAVRLPVGVPQITNRNQLTGLPSGYSYKDATSNVCFLGNPAPSYAGSPEGACAFHLSIGEAF